MRSSAFLLLAAALAWPPQRDAALSEMAEAERAFARAAADRGVRAAFLEFLDDEAIGFQPALGSAKAGYRVAPEPADPRATRLLWEPRTGAVAQSGELGWLTGPYTLVPGGDTARTRHGCYFSVWRRAGGGPWRVMLDVGIGTPEPCAFVPEGFHAMPDDADRFAGAVGDAKARVLDADRQLAAAVAARGQSAMTDRLHRSTRLHRDGRQPIVGRDAAAEWLRSSGDTTAFTPIDGAAARSGDVGYTYGRYARASGSGHYLRVWHCAASGAWRVVADIESPGK